MKQLTDRLNRKKLETQSKENMKAKQEDDNDQKDGLKIDGNMWFSNQFSHYLNMVQADTG
jgi:hypothetical protein